MTAGTAGSLRIVPLTPADTALADQAAQILHEAFLDRSASWQTLESARTEVLEAFSRERINRVAIDDDGRVVGWIGGIPMYDGHVLEVHPLVVAPAAQGRGVGRALIVDLEAIASGMGVSTLFVGTDDETYETTASSQDIYADVPSAISGLDTSSGHSFRFYERVGFSVIGLLPDANGPNKPDILMAKRVERA